MLFFFIVMGFLVFLFFNSFLTKCMEIEVEVAKSIETKVCNLDIEYIVSVGYRFSAVWLQYGIHSLLRSLQTFFFLTFYHGIV